MRRGRKRMGDMLLDEGLVTQEQVEFAAKAAREDGIFLGEELIKLGFVTQDSVADALSNQMRIPRVHLNEEHINDELLKTIPGETLRKYTMIPIDYSENNLNMVRVAMADPMNMNAIDNFTIVTNLQLDPVIATAHEIENALDLYYSDAETRKAMERFKTERKRDFGDMEDEEDHILDDQVDNSPVVQLVRSMLQQAARQRASDVHIEALENCVRVRFRIDGVLHERFRYDSDMADAITARIKIVSAMDISEKRKPQDGRMSMVVDHIEYDIRVSMLPTVYGEKCVMRLAQKKALNKDKRDLGLTPDDEKKFNKLLKNPNGIFLVTGPTGSGKSTTLYTVLNELNNEDVNIVTVEDPVEANIAGVNQVQVNNKAQLTFASALRSILRQDPDIIMIGEIRDGETAEIAVQASITGHLVVSTLHTNSSAGAMSRLMDMGVDSYLLADSVFGVIAQRLVRRLCDHCKELTEASIEEKHLMGLPEDKPFQMYKPCGCDKCGQTGYAGRIGVYEILTVTPRVKAMIHKGGTADDIKKVAMEEGMVTLKMNALNLVSQGITSF
ncbi:MAG: Flp pilus assembly complex ATPase component TadA, partial [Lachnospiraceae bacterium]|nr:Flp pilus assembly complex ATPase component TadA [Lachnospiraceae bacterium]